MPLSSRSYIWNFCYYFNNKSWCHHLYLEEHPQKKRFPDTAVEILIFFFIELITFSALYVYMICLKRNLNWSPGRSLSTSKDFTDPIWWGLYLFRARVTFSAPRIALASRKKQIQVTLLELCKEEGVGVDTHERAPWRPPDHAGQKHTLSHVLRWATTCGWGCLAFLSVPVRWPGSRCSSSRYRLLVIHPWRKRLLLPSCYRCIKPFSHMGLCE